MPEVVRSVETLTDPLTNTYTITYYYNDGSTSSRTVTIGTQIPNPVNLRPLLKEVYGGK